MMLLFSAIIHLKIKEKLRRKLLYHLKFRDSMLKKDLLNLKNKRNKVKTAIISKITYVKLDC